jgi:hypothetical protein
MGGGEGGDWFRANTAKKAMRLHGNMIARVEKL